MAKAYLVIRIKGQADVPYWANTTLRLLKLEKTRVAKASTKAEKGLNDRCAFLNQ